MMDKARLTEIAPDHYAISIYVKEFNLRFNHFLIKDEEPLLFHTGMKRMFPLVRDAVARVIDPFTLRWISFSHFEADECGALNEWLALAPQTKPPVRLGRSIGQRERLCHPSGAHADA